MLQIVLFTIPFNANDFLLRFKKNDRNDLTTYRFEFTFAL